MKKQAIFAILLVMIALILALTGSVLATNPLEPATTQGTSNLLGANEQGYGTGLPQEEVEADTDLNEVLNSLTSSRPKSNQGAIVTMIVAITVILIAGLITWWYKTNY